MKARSLTPEDIKIQDENAKLIYLFHEIDPNIHFACENWTTQDCKNYLRHHEPTKILDYERR